MDTNGMARVGAPTPSPGPQAISSAVAGGTYNERPVEFQPPLTIAEWAKNSRESIRVRLDQFHGRPTVDIRTWWIDETGELRPGRAGLTLAVRHVPALAAARADAEVTACKLGLLVEDAG